MGMSAPSSLIGRALELAARAHAGQVDKQHKPYIYEEWAE